MVRTKTVVDSNKQFANQHHHGQVCVFAGATAGIGMGTLRKLVTMLFSSTFYVIGRSEARFAEELARLRASGPTNKIVFIEDRVAVIACIDAICKKIIAAEKKVDILFMSCGGIPFQGAVYTDENLEQCFAVSYYSRLRLVNNLLPLLKAAPHPRVLSVLNGTLEKHIDENDLGLDKKWGMIPVVNHTTMCTSLAFDWLVANDDKKKLTLIHASPGLVSTGTPRSSLTKDDGYMWWALMTFLQILTGWITWNVGYSLNESAERHAYLLTTDNFAPGSWRTDKANDSQPDNEALTYYKERGWTDKVWDHTLNVWDKALNTPQLP